MASDLNIHLYLLTFNEQRIIRHTLNYYSEFCSKIIIHDNESTDDTVKIAKEFPSVEVKSFSTGNKYDEARQTRLRNSCWKDSRDADYVIVSDADEFLYSDNLVPDLVKLKEMSVAIPRINGYNMYGEVFPDDYSRPIMDQLKMGVRSFNFDKRIIFDPKVVKDIMFSYGSHKCFPEFMPYQTKDINVPDSPILKLLHYKWIDMDYVSQRHRMNDQRMCDHSRAIGCGFEYTKGDEFIISAFETLKRSSTQVI